MFYCFNKTLPSVCAVKLDAFVLKKLTWSAAICARFRKSQKRLALPSPLSNPLPCQTFSLVKPFPQMMDIPNHKEVFTRCKNLKPVRTVSRHIQMCQGLRNCTVHTSVHTYSLFGNAVVKKYTVCCILKCIVTFWI